MKRGTIRTKTAGRTTRKRSQLVTRVPRSMTLTRFAGLSESEIDGLLGYDVALAQLSAAAASGLADVGEIAGLADFLKKVKGALKPPPALAAKLKAAGNWILKNGGTVLKIASSAVSTIYPPAGIILGPLTTAISKGLDKANATKQMLERAAALVKAAPAKQAALLNVVQKVQESIVKAKAEGTPIPKTIQIEESAIQKMAQGIAPTGKLETPEPVVTETTTTTPAQMPGAETPTPAPERPTPDTQKADLITHVALPEEGLKAKVRFNA